MPGYSSSSNSGDKLPLREILGGGRVADVLLWKDKRLSGVVLATATAVWLLLEVAEYSLLSLLCHISITAMLFVFIGCNGAALVGRETPKIPEVILSSDALEKAARSFHSKLNRFLGLLHRVASGEDPKLFLLVLLQYSLVLSILLHAQTITVLWVISVVGSYAGSVNLLYLGFLCIQTLAFLYYKYEDDVDRLASRGRRDINEVYERFDTKVMKKIPRGPRVDPSKDKFT
ncbi:hypothetical protein Taro_012295 [Colocasia esculenta]|uniref:Reticulon-like protein n=1 Tax=Colocasia esculenta TaxID=4460 RepID=A0A843U3K9_COLES|nr:hypothetical protein [Colocasia esculenta]